MKPSEWSKQDSKVAREEGWDLYYSKGSLDGDWQIQRNDEDAIIEDDMEAHKIVATSREPHHRKALTILLHNNLKECILVVKHKFNHYEIP